MHLELPIFCTCAIEPSLTLGNSNGHGCMLQYALLHLFGYALSIDDLKNFRVRSLLHVPLPLQ